MSKKGTDTPSALRIRENQRRSRNRRKELIEHLQARINEYERKGVQATQEIQRAARRVAEENIRLRSLLTRHGIPQEEVDACLQSGDWNDKHAPYHQDRFTNTGPLQQSRASNEPSQCPIQKPTAAQNATAQSHPPYSSSAISSSQLQQQSYPILPTPQQPTYPPQEDPTCPTTAECFCPPPAAPPPRPRSSTGLEISCETAAAIIVEMHGDGGDMESIRASLGCLGHEECSVRNSTVLQIMDERG
ncbi:hypothetical protein ACEQ8H_002980 [Pleosporales sp. CAS-2024a]